MIPHYAPKYFLLACTLMIAPLAFAQQITKPNEPSLDKYQQRVVSGWNVYLRHELLTKQKRMTDRALNLLKKQLDEIVRVVPRSAVTELQKVDLFFSPEYAGVRPKAEYHPSAGWLRDNQRDTNMARSVEFTNVRIFLQESRRMPNFALHELSHAYHHRFLDKGFQNPRVRETFQRAKAAGKYNNVRRRDAKGNETRERAYAMTNPQEYFAEISEAYFSKNDFFPFDNTELKAHDPAGFEMVKAMWMK